MSQFNVGQVVTCILRHAASGDYKVIVFVCYNGDLLLMIKTFPLYILKKFLESLNFFLYKLPIELVSDVFAGIKVLVNY